jgi:phosphocarrier protein HPr
VFDVNLVSAACGSERERVCVECVVYATRKENIDVGITIKEKENKIMREFSYVITDAQGIHARPAGQLVKLAAAYPCKVTIAKDGRSVDAKRIMGVMSLGAKQGQEVILQADGEQEDEAIAALSAFMNENL